MTKQKTTGSLPPKPSETMQFYGKPRERQTAPTGIERQPKEAFTSPEFNALLNSICPVGQAAVGGRKVKRNFGDEYNDAQYHDPEDYSSQESWVGNKTPVQCAQPVGSRDASVPATETSSGSPVSRVSCTPGMEIPEGSLVVRGGATGSQEIANCYNEYCVRYSKLKLVEEAFRYELSPKLGQLMNGIDEAQTRFEQDEGAVTAMAEKDINEVLELKKQRATMHEAVLRRLAEERSSEERVHQWWMSYWEHKGAPQEVNFQAWSRYWSNQQFNSQAWVDECNSRREDQMRGHQGYLVNWEYRRGEEERKHKEWMDRFDSVVLELSGVLHHNVSVVQTVFNQAIEDANCELRMLTGKIARLQEDWVRYKEGMDSLYRHVAQQEALEAYLMKEHLGLQMPEASFIIFY